MNRKVAPRILAVVASRVLYGQERGNLRALEALRDSGCEVTAIVEANPNFRIMAEELSRRSIPQIESPIVGRRATGYLWDFLLGNPVRYVKANRLMIRWIREFAPTHIHVPNPFHFLTYFHSLQQDVAVIYRIGDKPSTHNVFWRWVWKRIVCRVNHFVAISEFIASELQKLGVERDRITVIYNAPTLRSNPPQPDRLPHHPQHVLFIGQITSDKGVDLLIEAFRKVVVVYPEARLTIVGRISDWSGDEWARALQDVTYRDSFLADKVHFAGEIEDIYGCLSTASFLVVPSKLEEALSNVVGEAKAAARPAVVFPSGGLPELILHEHDGFVCRDTSVEALVEGLSYYLSNRDRVGRHGRNALASLEKLGLGDFDLRWREVYDCTMPRGSCGR